MSQYRKRIFFTSDLHIGHANCLKFDNRPFDSLEDMHSSFIRRFNSVLDDDSITYFLGDVGLAKGSIIADVINEINGTKILVIGNHDGGVNSMYNAGFDCVINSAMLYIAQERVTMSHCPLRGVPREDISGMRGAVEGENWHKEFKHVKYSIENEGQFHLSGHIHSPSHGKSTKILHRQFDIGVVSNKYGPVSISQIESWINFTKKREEEWVDIRGFDGYKVNYYGQIKSFKRYKDGVLLKPYTDKDGYKCVSIRCDGESKGKKIHRLVAEAFLDNIDNLPQVNHKNGLKFDNTMTNLEWISNVDNQRHAWDSDLKTIKLTTEDVSYIKARLENGESNSSIARYFKVDQSTISNIKNNKTWKRIERK